LVELLALLLDAYQKTFHPPIAFLFSWLPIPLPAGMKDAVLVYIAMVGVLYRGLSYRGRPVDIAARFARPRLRMFVGQSFAAFFWPYLSYQFFAGRYYWSGTSEIVTVVGCRRWIRIRSKRFWPAMLESRGFFATSES